MVLQTYFGEGASGVVLRPWNILSGGLLSEMNYDLSRLGIGDLNAMQQDTLQTVRKGASVVLLSPTGSGKTLAYMLPLLQLMDSKKEVLQSLVLVPSRELAIQTVDVVKRIFLWCRS